MANGVSFINVLVGDDFKKEFKIALAKEGKSQTEFVLEKVQELIDKHKDKKKK